MPTTRWLAERAMVRRRIWQEGGNRRPHREREYGDSSRLLMAKEAIATALNIWDLPLDFASPKIRGEKINHTEGLSKVDGPSEPKVVDDQLKGLLKKQPANRCAQCQKKIGLIGFKCRCGGAFCSSHRYSEAHECSFDYKATGRVVLAKENPVVMAKKLEKI
ncbi:hypothetical protein ZIOFF_022497 [Zingiber officinale]|uniref:AN1-type domain-containing protein n=1 Tax=Zingiber officinale TaxID=94328 RepID=A0A8J5H591_ZINOF|nr:hypothetical protein ZIOFF_022497 [Zingiber officinale]